MQIPGVAINGSSAITGVEAVCSPPPQHQPFSLPETYMHGRDAKAVVGAKALPGEERFPSSSMMGVYDYQGHEDVFLPYTAVPAR